MDIGIRALVAFAGLGAVLLFAENGLAAQKVPAGKDAGLCGPRQFVMDDVTGGIFASPFAPGVGTCGGSGTEGNDTGGQGRTRREDPGNPTVPGVSSVTVKVSIK
ncbi:MAG: hypothetical protein A2V83_01910 [Nitrospirae bacterium RBG_16_64_22]|nr:MAG: hypothetical protein A2V83_01910 [Nitrospirae bacterium RBG_16_64_22]